MGLNTGSKKTSLDGMTTPLSAKAKGKQRAVEPIDELQVPDNSRELTIRFTEGIPDLVLQVHPNDTIRDLKRIVSPCFGPGLQLMISTWNSRYGMLGHSLMIDVFGLFIPADC